MKLVKTPNDIKKENKDLAEDPIMAYLANQHLTKFNVGDILVKEECSYDENNAPNWEIERDAIGAPIKYVYAFENKYGIGYVKKLEASGKGPSKAQPIPMTSLDWTDERFKLDPEFADHMIIGDGEFKYAEQFERLRKYREEAIQRNIANAQLLATEEEIRKFWKSLKKGDVFYIGDPSYKKKAEVMFETGFEVLKVKRDGSLELKTVYSHYDYELGDVEQWEADQLLNDGNYVSFTKPVPLEEHKVI